MNKAAAIIRSLRLRTLPLSLAGVVLGILIATVEHNFSASGIVFTLLTTVFLQIISNLSNELGDYLSGTDSEQREGPMYSLANGKLTVHEFKVLIGIFVGLCCISGLLMIGTTFGTLFGIKSIGLILLGACAIWAAIQYTLGKKPYGYRGLGDVFVFLFFGLVSVMGGYFVTAQTLDTWSILLPAITMGCFSVGVLNTNNIRDMESDVRTRITIPLKIGEIKAKWYQTILILTGWSAMILFSILSFTSLWNLLYLITLPLFIKHIHGIWKRHGKALDNLLPLLVMASFVFSILAGVGLLIG